LTVAGARYDVKVEGGKGAVIGDYATVIQVFKDAPAPLSSQIRTQEFTALVEERTRNFVGREYVFKAVDEALADPEFPSGYLVIRGEPGIGKTAIIAQLVKDRAFIHHFNVASLGIRSPQAFLSNICAQLIVRYGLDHSYLPAEATHDGGFLSQLLVEAAATKQLPVVVAVDALDEAEDLALPAGANRLFLPTSVPEGVYFVVSTRPKLTYQLFADRKRDFYLNDNDPQNLDDVATYIRHQLTAKRERLQPRIEDWEVAEDEFIEVLTAKSEGNFMYLVHVLRDIESGALTAANIDNILNLPQGLKGYYERHWNDMRSADEEQFRKYQQPVVCLLATAREPVTVVQLLEWTVHFWQRRAWDSTALDPIAVKDVLTAWREFLDEVPTNGERRFRVYHASFQEFLADEVGLVAYHETISETALAKIPGFGD
jgi:AAA ATPase-like protein